MRALLLLALLAGCATPSLPPERLAPQLSCADECRTRCQLETPLWLPPDARAPEAWDFIRPQVVIPLSAELQRCEQRRAACVACIDAAIRAGAVRP